jgi:hypothetical protein
MSGVSTVKEAVKESLVGVEEPAQLSAQTKARFNSHAIKDPQTGELYLGPDQFIDAIAPKDEDYVSLPLSLRLLSFIPFCSSPPLFPLLLFQRLYLRSFFFCLF